MADARAKFAKNDALMCPGYPPNLKGARLERLKRLAEETSAAFPPPFIDASYEGPLSTPVGDRALERGRWAVKNHTPAPRENGAEPLEGPNFPTAEELEKELGGPEGMFTICGCHYRGMFGNPRMNVLFDAREKDSNVCAMDHGKRIAAVFLDRWMGYHERGELDHGWYASLGRPHKTLIDAVSHSHTVAKKCPMRPKAQQVKTPTGMPKGHPLSNMRFTVDQRDSWLGHMMCAAEECGASQAFQEKLGKWMAAATSQYAGFYDEATGRMDWMSEPPYGTYIDINAAKKLDAKDAQAALVLAQHGNDAATIAMMLKVSVDDVQLTLAKDEAKPPPQQKRAAPIVKQGSDFHAEQYLDDKAARAHRREVRPGLKKSDSEYARELQAQIDAEEGGEAPPPARARDPLPPLVEHPPAAPDPVEERFAALEAELKALRAEVLSMRGVMYRTGTMMAEEALKK